MMKSLPVYRITRRVTFDEQLPAAAAAAAAVPTL